MENNGWYICTKYGYISTYAFGVSVSPARHHAILIHATTTGLLTRDCQQHDTSDGKACGGVRRTRRAPVDQHGKSGLRERHGHGLHKVRRKRRVCLLELGGGMDG